MAVALPLTGRFLGCASLRIDATLEGKHPEVRSGGLMAFPAALRSRGNYLLCGLSGLDQVGRPMPHAFPRRPVPRRGVERSMPHLASIGVTKPDVNALSPRSKR